MILQFSLFIFFHVIKIDPFVPCCKSDWHAKRFGGHDKHFINFPGSTSRKMYDVAMQLIFSQRASSYFQLIKIDPPLYCAPSEYTKVRVAREKKWALLKNSQSVSATIASQRYTPVIFRWLEEKF